MTPGRFVLLALFLASTAFIVAFFDARTPPALAVVACGLCLVPGVQHLRTYFSSRMNPAGKPLTPLKTGSDPTKPGYFWAGQSLNFDDACRHFVTVGATGSGKSVTLNMLLQSVVGKMGSPGGPKRRVVVYDAKADLVSFIASINPSAKLLLFNPLDSRFTPWDIAADTLTETDAYEFASILIPRNERENAPYFTDTSRNLIAGVIKRFIATGGKRWTLRDLVLAFETLPRLKAVLTHDETRYLLDHFDPQNGESFAGVKSTVDNTLALYRPIAALFDSAVRKGQTALSLCDWIKSENTVLVLGNHEGAREATDTLNRLIFHQLSKLLISREGRIKKNETWIFLDEVREAGKSSGLRQLLLRGRSKGVSVALGFQDIHGIYAAYGKNEGAEIVGAAQNIVVLHINSSAPETAEWAASIFGSRRDIVRSDSVSHGQQYQTGTSKKEELVANVIPLMLTQLHMPSEAAGISYFAYTNKFGHIESNYDWEYLTKYGQFKNSDQNVEDFKYQTDPESFRLQPWKVDDLERLGLPVSALAGAGIQTAPKASTAPVPLRDPLLDLGAGAQ